MKAFLRPGLYRGTVWHKRHRPVVHAFRYPVFYLFLDLCAGNEGRLPWCLSRNRFNLFSVYDKDYADVGPAGLEDRLRQRVADLGIEQAVASIRILTMPRVLGYQFNPLTLFYCYSDDRDLLAVLYEVHNTFGDKHIYAFPLASQDDLKSVHETDKAFFVSPFFDVSGRYRFRQKEQEGRLKLHIEYLDDEQRSAMSAGLDLKGQNLSAPVLLKAFFAIPLLSIKVIAAIHYEAARLWIKKVGFRSPPSAPTGHTTYVTLKDPR
ncbi:DUF1365 domain-containing protein [Rhodovibrionaceae bacterium A322]